MAVVVLAACAAIVVRTIPSSPSPAPPAVAHSASLAADGRSHATLEVTAGTLVLTIGVANLGASGTLLRVTTPAGSSAPRLRVADGNGTAGPGGSAVVYLSATRAAAITVTLNAAVSWQLNLASGTRQTTADLRGGLLAGIAITKGSYVIDLTLPRPHGSVPVRLAAGANQLRLSLPSGVPVRVTAAAGAGEISLDGKKHTAVRDGSVFKTPTWAPGAAGFDIEAIAGAARVTVTTQAG
jgi:hypothetical protein